MNPEQREYGQRKLADLDREIKKLVELIGRSATQASREFWRAEASRLEEQRKNLGAMLREELTTRRVDLLAT